MARSQERPPASRSGPRDDVVPLTRMRSDRLGGGQTRSSPPGNRISFDDFQPTKSTIPLVSYPDKPLPKMPNEQPILELKDVGCYKAPGQPIFTHVNLTVKEGDVVILRGKSGGG